MSASLTPFQMTAAPATATKLSTAEDRREAVSHAAASVFAQRGIHGTPTAAVAKEAGISQAYLFRLFPTKTDLAIALVDRSHERILRTFAEAATRAKAADVDVLEAMGDAYVELQDRQLLLLQLPLRPPPVHARDPRGDARRLPPAGRARAAHSPAPPTRRSAASSPRACSSTSSARSTPTSSISPGRGSSWAMPAEPPFFRRAMTDHSHTKEFTR